MVDVRAGGGPSTQGGGVCVGGWVVDKALHKDPRRPERIYFPMISRGIKSKASLKIPNHSFLADYSGGGTLIRELGQYGL